MDNHGRPGRQGGNVPVERETVVLHSQRMPLLPRVEEILRLQLLRPKPEPGRAKSPAEREDTMKTISIDNGHSTVTAAEAIAAVAWETIVEKMDAETREKVHAEGPETEEEFELRMRQKEWAKESAVKSLKCLIDRNPMEAIEYLKELNLI